MSKTLPDLTARSMDSRILNMLPENRFKRPLMLITETLRLWKLLWYGIEVDIRFMGMFLVTAKEYNLISVFNAIHLFGDVQISF